MVIFKRFFSKKFSDGTEKPMKPTKMTTNYKSEIFWIFNEFRRKPMPKNPGNPKNMERFQIISNHYHIYQTYGFRHL